MEREPSSFRDPEGFLFYEDDKIKRALKTPEAIQRMDVLLKSKFYQDLHSKLIPTIMKNEVLIHEKVNLVTYPYEWSFSMLADAALVQLGILEKGLNEGYILKDGSAYNCLYHQGKMVFVDILSVDRMKDRYIWDGYHQFCEHFLYPLMLKAYKKINFQNLWRGSGDGISTHNFYQLLNFHDYFKKGIFLHSVLKTRLTNTIQKETVIDTQASGQNQKHALTKLVHNLKAIILRLRDIHSTSIWTDYAKNNTYTDGKNSQKHAYIEKFLQSLTSKDSLVDLGCNTGEYTEIASKYVKLVKAVDFDADCIDRLYLKILKGKCSTNIVPIVGDLMNLSPAQGWVLSEQKDLVGRLKSNSFLALALIHHICISKNVPLGHFIEFLSHMGDKGIIEWVDIEDPMVKVLLKNRKNIFDNYTWDHFKSAVERYFILDETFQFQGSGRILCIVTKK